MEGYKPMTPLPKRARGALLARSDYDQTEAVASFCRQTMRDVLLHAGSKKWRPLFPDLVVGENANHLVRKIFNAIDTRDIDALRDYRPRIEKIAGSISGTQRWKTHRIKLQSEGDIPPARRKEIADLAAHSSLQRAVANIASCSTRAVLAASERSTPLVASNIDAIVEYCGGLGSCIGLGSGLLIGRLVQCVRKAPMPPKRPGTPPPPPAVAYTPDTIQPLHHDAPPSVPSNEPDPFDAFVRSLTAKGKPRS